MTAAALSPQVGAMTKSWHHAERIFFGNRCAWGTAAALELRKALQSSDICWHAHEDWKN